MRQKTSGKTETAKTAFSDWEWTQKYVWQHSRNACAQVELEESQEMWWLFYECKYYHTALIITQ